MFFSRQDWRNLSVDNHAMSVTTETATRISMLAEKVPSLYRRRRALVFISSPFSRMVEERIARFAQLDTKARPGVLHITYRLRHLPNRHFFQVGRRRSSEQLPCERSSSLENVTRPRKSASTRSATVILRTRPVSAAHTIFSGLCEGQEEHRVDKDDSLALLRSTYAKFLAPALLQRGCRRSS